MALLLAMAVMAGNATGTAFMTSLGQRPQADAAPRSVRPVGVPMPSVEPGSVPHGSASLSGIALVSMTLLCVAASRAGGKAHRMPRGSTGCRVVAINAPLPQVRTLDQPPRQQAAEAPALLGDILEMTSPVPQAQPCAVVMPTEGLCSLAPAAEALSPQSTVSAMEADHTPAAAFGHTAASRRCRAARRVGSARHARSRSGRRGGTARAAHRRCGAMLQRPFEVSETGCPAYDPSRVRAKIQSGLRSVSRPGRQNGRELRTAASGESVCGMSDLYAASSNIVSIKRHHVKRNMT